MNMNKIKREYGQKGLRVTARNGLIYVADNTLKRGFNCKTFLTLKEALVFLNNCEVLI